MKRRYASQAKRSFPLFTGESVDRPIVHSEVQNSIHHPGHRNRCPGSDGNQERVIGIAEPLAHEAFEPVEVIFYFPVQSRRMLLSFS